MQKKVYGSSSTDQIAYDVETDACGDIFTCGILKGVQPPFFDTVPVQRYSGFGTGVICKHSPDGTAMWVRTFGSNCFNGACAYTDITVDAQCNVYACGYIACGDLILDGDTISTGAGKLIVKYDSNGNRLWYKIFPSTQLNYRFGIDHSETGCLYVATSFSDSIDVNGQVFYTSGGSSDIDPVIIKLREDGSVIWVKHFGGINQEINHSIASGDSGRFYFSGQFYNNAVFDTLVVPTFGTWGAESSYLVTCDSSGKLERARLYGYGSDFYRVNKNGLGGWIASGQQGLNAVHSIYSWSQLIIGVYGSSSQTGGIDPPKAYGACGDPAGNMYVTGSFDDHFSLGGLSGNRYVSFPGNRFESYLGVYDVNHEIIGLVNVPNPGYDDAGNAVAFLPPSTILVAGQQGEVTASKDYYLAIYDVATVLKVNEVDKLSVTLYPNPVRDNFSIAIRDFDNEEGTVALYSMTGTLLKKFDLRKNSNGIYSLSLADFPAGTYMVHVLSRGKSVCKIVVKE